MYLLHSCSSLFHIGYSAPVLSKERLYIPIQGTAISPSDGVALGFAAFQERQLRKLVFFNDRAEHLREALRITNLILHVVDALEHRKMSAWVNLLHRVPIFEMLLNASKFKEGVLLQRLREGWERLVFQTAPHLPLLVSVGQGFSGGDEIGLDGIIVAPENFLKRTAL